MFAVSIEEDYSPFSDEDVVGWDVYAELSDAVELIGYVSRKGYEAEGVGHDNLSDATFSIANAVYNRVRAGAILLDEYRADWWKLIDTDRLAMNMFDRCIIGQLFNVVAPVPGDFDTSSCSAQYNTALDSMGVEWGKDSEYGFDSFGDYLIHETLKACWIEQIEWRREKNSD